MTWVNGLTLDEVNGLVADSYPFEAKTFRAFMLIMARLRVYGSLPVDDRSMASIAGCTRHWWANRAWPALRELFEVTEEGRLYHPGVRSVRDQPVPGEDDAERAARAARNQANAVAGWEKRRAAMHVVPPEGPHAVASKSHAKTDAKSDTFAFDPHAGPAQVASGAASPAASGSHDLASDAPSLSLQRDSLSEGDKSQTESLGERASARASAHATADAPRPAADATQPAADARGDATSHATRAPPRTATRGPERHRPAPPIGPIPADWTPSEANLAFGKSRGYDEQQLSEIVGNYRDYRLGHGDLRADFDADFRAWLRREAPPPARAQGHLTMPIPGGTEPPAPSVAWLNDDPDNPRLAAAWNGAHAALRKELGDAIYRQWLARMVLQGRDGPEILIALPSEFLRDRVRGAYGARIKTLLLEAYPDAERVDFRVNARAA